MTEDFEFTYVKEPDWDVIGGGISEYNLQQAGDDTGVYLCFVAKTPDQKVVGGVIGVTYYEWLFIQLMWVKEDLRSHGLGHRLLELAEDEGRKRGAKNAFLDTFSFQAPEFYKKYGYEVFGTLPDFPPGHTRYYMKKKL